ncbi:MAG TPA: plastocyanin/azurin family copper-binding protein [Tepidisphaeraceae bacterium]|jgi:plastocyanin|nr:plastocyanin/azurin family copper-binding protein [Tepidisphaeraceae bacterium]
MLIRSFSAFLVCGALCIAYACAQTTQPAESGQNGTVTIKMTNDMTFEPATITVAVGTTVRWENPSKDVHTVTFDPKRASDAKDVSLPKGAKAFDSGDVKPGGVYSHQFTIPGTYKYICIPHEDMGMLGQIEVKAVR